MLSIFDFAREMDFLGIFSRLILAVICGGIVGIERELKHRPAGFRTHILICLGASITTLTSQYLYLTLHLYTDIARLGAQVIAGIGFIGAGSIIVTKGKRIKGLTTAAGLWTSAIVGLVCGAGYVECAVSATFLVIFAELVLSRIEYALEKDYSDLNLYVEYSDPSAIDGIIRTVKELKAVVTDLEITRTTSPDKEHYYCAILSVQSSRKVNNEDLLDRLRDTEYVKIIEEL